MKTHTILLFRSCSSAALAAVFSLMLASVSQAKDKDHGNNGKHAAESHKHEQKFEQKFAKKTEPKFEKKEEKKFEQQIHKAEHKEDHGRVEYLAHPRSSYVLSPGVGYAGRGYYFGPPNSPYYYQHPDVRFFPKREDFPGGYAFRPSSPYAGDGAAVQEALARLGYYQGPIDGRVGPQTLRAIAQYEQDHGMGITNGIVPALLQALGLQ